jgi:hypothetical protein
LSRIHHSIDDGRDGADLGGVIGNDQCGFFLLYVKPYAEVGLLSHGQAHTGERGRKPAGFDAHLVVAGEQVIEHEKPSFGSRGNPLSSGRGVLRCNLRGGHNCSLRVNHIAVQNGRAQFLGVRGYSERKHTQQQYVFQDPPHRLE